MISQEGRWKFPVLLAISKLIIRRVSKSWQHQSDWLPMYTIAIMPQVSGSSPYCARRTVAVAKTRSFRETTLPRTIKDRSFAFVLLNYFFYFLGDLVIEMDSIAVLMSSPSSFSLMPSIISSALSLIVINLPSRNHFAFGHRLLNQHNL